MFQPNAFPPTLMQIQGRYSGMSSREQISLAFVFTLLYRLSSVRNGRMNKILTIAIFASKGGTWNMVMKTGERWHCTNPTCRCSILVETSGDGEGKNPLCACGSVMKKQYSAPVFQYLDFLRFPESSATLQETRKD